MRADNPTGIRNLCAVAVQLRQTMPVNAATKFAIRTVLREAINKSNSKYKGNVNRKNCRYLSVAAEQRQIYDSKAILIADHAVPVSVSLRAFDDLQDLALDGVVLLVAKYTVMVLITPEEDERLRAAGLVKCMPLDWEQDILARYKHVGIEVKINPSFQPTAEAMAMEDGELALAVLSGKIKPPR
jgi:hypothetical protein